MEQREIAYSIYEKDDEYLRINNLYDENDLIRLFFERNKNSLPEFDYILVDEVQDYTELQLFLMHELSKDKHNIVFAGDIHQIINPTVFNEGRLKSLYFNDNLTLDFYFLQKNFRCQQGVIDLANKVSDLRRSVVGKKSSEFEQIEEAARNDIISLPQRLPYTEENIIELLKTIVRFPQVAILVPSETTRDKILSIIDKYQLEDIPIISTISEIKGMEYQYVICFDMIGFYNDVWCHILQHYGESKKETKFRFSFNSLYVAITRAQ